jgi:hypothetical protein
MEHRILINSGVSLAETFSLRGEEENSRRSCSPGGDRSNFLGHLRRTPMNFFGTFWQVEIYRNPAPRDKKYILKISNDGNYQIGAAKQTS